MRGNCHTIQEFNIFIKHRELCANGQRYRLSEKTLTPYYQNHKDLNVWFQSRKTIIFVKKRGIK
jgi:hypothetical protein